VAVDHALDFRMPLVYFTVNVALNIARRAIGVNRRRILYPVFHDVGS
jgi:hypothetical protein